MDHPARGKFVATVFRVFVDWIGLDWIAIVIVIVIVPVLMPCFYFLFFIWSCSLFYFKCAFFDVRRAW